MSAHSRLTAVTATATQLTAIGASNVAAAARFGPRGCARWVVRPSPTKGVAALLDVAAARHNARNELDQHADLARSRRTPGRGCR